MNTIPLPTSTLRRLPETFHSEFHTRLLRVGTDGSSSETAIGDWTEDQVPGPSGTDIIQINGNQVLEPVGIFTDADQGVLLSVSYSYPAAPVGLMTVSGGSVTSNVTLPSSIYVVQPVLQAQDGTFYGLGGIPLRTYPWGNPTLLEGYWDYPGDFTNYILNNVCESTACN